MLVDGKALAASLKEDMRTYIKEQNLAPHLTIICVGNDPVIEQFVNLKKKFGEYIGVSVSVIRFPSEISEKEILDELSNLKEKTDGVVVQLPLPPHILKEHVLNALPLGLDVDVLGIDAYSAFEHGTRDMIPPVAGAVANILQHHKISPEGKRVVIVGDGLLVGKPVAQWFSHQGIIPTVVTVDTPNKEEVYKEADVIISGAGAPRSITPSMIKDGVVLIDAGSSSEKGMVVGDIDPLCATHASLFSPVPGGVGPLTVAHLFHNLVYNTKR